MEERASELIPDEGRVVDSVSADVLCSLERRARVELNASTGGIEERSYDLLRSELTCAGVPSIGKDHVRRPKSCFEILCQT
jgi:hypothetical protein